MYEITKELIASHEKLTASLKENIHALEEAHERGDILQKYINELSNTVVMGFIFTAHIQAHLKEDEHIMCKICNKTIDEIYEEDKVKYVKEEIRVYLP